MTKNKLLIAGLIASACLSAKANALDIDPVLGVSALQTRYTFKTENEGKLKKNHTAGEVSLGARFNIYEGFFMTPEWYYNVFSSVKKSYTAAPSKAETKLKVNDLTGARINIGYSFLDQFDVYGAVSYGLVRSKFFQGATTESNNKWLFKYEAGVQYKFTDMLSVKLAYQIQPKHKIFGEGKANENIKLESQQVKLGVNFNMASLF